MKADQIQLKGQCVGLCPPYAVFATVPNVDRELSGNLFFQKLKNITTSVRLGQMFTFQLDPDISSHFRAGSLMSEQNPSASKFSLSQQPGKAISVVTKLLPWENGDYKFKFSRLHPLFDDTIPVLPVQQAGKFI